MSCPQCRGLESIFDDKTAAKELKSYRKKGPSKTSRLLIEALKTEGIENLTLLDIGGGVGAIQHELFKAGIKKATNVDASSAYLNTAQKEAQQQGNSSKVTYHHGNFVELASELTSADIVTLDRAICCYPDMPALVGASSEKAIKLYGLVYPRDTWWLKIGKTIINLGLWLFRASFRFFVHPTSAVEAILQEKGLRRCFQHKTLLWQIAVFSR